MSKQLDLLEDALNKARLAQAEGNYKPEERIQALSRAFSDFVRAAIITEKANARMRRAVMTSKSANQRPRRGMALKLGEMVVIRVNDSMSPEHRWNAKEGIFQGFCRLREAGDPGVGAFTEIEASSGGNPYAVVALTNDRDGSTFKVVIKRGHVFAVSSLTNTESTC